MIDIIKKLEECEKILASKRKYNAAANIRDLINQSENEDEINVENNHGQINIAKGNSSINASQATKKFSW